MDVPALCWSRYVTGTMTEFMLLAKASNLSGVDMYDYVNATTGNVSCSAILHARLKFRLVIRPISLSDVCT